MRNTFADLMLRQSQEWLAVAGTQEDRESSNQALRLAETLLREAMAAVQRAGEDFDKDPN